MHCRCGGETFIEAYQAGQKGAVCVECGTFYADEKMEKMAEMEILARVKS